MGIILIILSFFLTKIIMLPIANLLTASGVVKENYLGNKIPVGMGLVIWLGTFPSLLIYDKVTSNSCFIIYVLILTITLLVGFIDDLLGDHSVKGLKGHLFKLFKNKELTSGALKALIISIASFIIAWNMSANLIHWIINFILLILTTNSFNLLDVRPGRVLKGYIFAAILLFVFYPVSRFLLSVLTASLVAYAPWDFKGKVMLGDAGSNFLGMTIGLAIITSLDFFYKIIITIFLVYLHFYTEKKSLTSLIDKVYILRLLDNLGR